MSKTHYFYVEIAKLYGINSAVILQHLWFWVKKNEEDGSNFHDGYYWTFNSRKAFSKFFPYMTARQIRYATKKLIDSGVVICKNYNKNAYDRTLWYTISKDGRSLLQNCEMDKPKL